MSKLKYWLWAKGFLETADWFHLARESIRLAKKVWKADLHLFIQLLEQRIVIPESRQSFQIPSEVLRKGRK